MSQSKQYDRYWLLTWTTYGSWLPGDPRGFVGKQRDEEGDAFLHNIPGTPYDADVDELSRTAQRKLKRDPIALSQTQAAALLNQFQETAEYRGWQLCAAAVMRTHVHIVVGVEGDPAPSKLIADFKSYGSRRLNHEWGKPASETWWTRFGSKRKLPDEIAVLAGVRYVRDQESPLAIWLDEGFEAEIGPRTS